MDELIAPKYPFESAIDFFIGGFFLDVSALHLSTAYLMLIIFFLYFLHQEKYDLTKVISIAYFCLQPFNNPAFTIFGIAFADYLGIAISTILIVQILYKKIIISKLSLFLLAFSFLAMVHATLVWIFFPELVQFAPIDNRLIVIFRIIILALVIIYIHNRNDVDQVINTAAAMCGLSFIIILCVYIIQAMTLLSGNVSYGTFAGAGNTLYVAFGGVSIERGHLSKFMAPMLAFIAIYAMQRKKWNVFAFYILLMCVNFSASGFSFIIVQLLFLAVLFRKSVINFVFTGYGVFTSLVFVMLSIYFHEAYSALFQKIYEFAILGDESEGAGRSFGLFLDYLYGYPFGLGYSGSSFRTAPGLPEINMGIYAFISQMSILAVPVLIAYGMMLIYLWHRHSGGTPTARLLLVGSFATILGFSADTYWFMPLWWLPISILMHPRHDRLPENTTI